MSREDAVKKANEVLAFLKKIDDVLLEVSNDRMQPIFDRILTNNQPSPGSYMERVNWLEAPAYLREIFLPKYQNEFHLPSTIIIDSSWIHIEDCYEDVLVGDCEIHPYNPAQYNGPPQLHRCRTCDIPKIHSPLTCFKPNQDDVLVWFHAIKAQVHNGTLDKSKFPPDADNFFYMVNFVHPDLKDLYE